MPLLGDISKPWSRFNLSFLSNRRSIDHVLTLLCLNKKIQQLTGKPRSSPKKRSCHRRLEQMRLEVPSSTGCAKLDYVSSWWIPSGGTSRGGKHTRRLRERLKELLDGQPHRRTLLS